ncbi:OmpA family protein [Cohaesibacter sp. CAU 1516]|uniref:OmpA family protein n=1 Tax=Cohaesibacter sp. CAU 1516 TaxID=2576038 RepID=UPI0014858559|nr:OmpA family protein [Cohaesibacter sp. CAU 1516]
MSMLKNWVIPGALAVGVVTAISLYTKTAKMEADLTERATAILADKGMDWATVTFDGRDGVLTGVAPEEGDSAWAVELIDIVWGVHAITDETSLLPTHSPFTWGLERDGNKLAMIGYLPYDLSKSVPADMQTLFDGVVFASSTEASRGAPDGMDKVVALSADLASQLPNAKIMLVDDTLTVTGTLEDGNKDHIELFNAIQSRLAAADLGAIKLDLKIAEPKAPAEDTDKGGSAKAKDGLLISRTEQGVSIFGTVPSEEIKNQLVDQATRKFGQTGVKLELAIQEGVKIAGLGYDEFKQAALTSLQAVSRLDAGIADLSPEGLSLKGGAYYDAAMQKVKDSLTGILPDGFALNADLSVAAPGEVVDAGVCQTLMRGALTDNTILFDSGKSTISEDSFGLLDGLIYTARRCPDSRIQIAGHTDSDGDDATNQQLSERRADAVVAYLSEAGLSQDRLEPKGYGETMPVESNDTAEGKAKNRRIEFVILAQ